MLLIVGDHDTIIGLGDSGDDRRSHSTSWITVVVRVSIWPLSPSTVSSRLTTAMGNATSVTNPSATTTYSKTRTFDELGRLIQSVGAVAANSRYRFGYDRTSNLTSVTDPRSNTFSYGFDTLNRLVQKTDEEHAPVTLTRNGIDAITAYQDPRSITTTYVRNGFGEIIQETSPDKGVVRSFRWNGRMPYGTGSSWERHDHARRPSSNTAIASFARDAEPGTGNQPQDGGEVA